MESATPEEFGKLRLMAPVSSRVNLNVYLAGLKVSVRAVAELPSALEDSAGASTVLTTEMSMGFYCIIYSPKRSVEVVSLYATIFNFETSLMLSN